MNKYLNYINEFHGGNSKEIEFINNQLKKHLSENEENQTEIETILDYLFSNPKVKISEIGYKTILEKTEKWHKKLQSIQTKNDEEVGKDYEIVKDFGDGFKFVKLLSQNSYNREGKLISHCVASYYGRNVNIYSLRDSNNKPHCTIEENRQIKGKGNGNIDPKYIDYVVKFLEHLGMNVGENEMKNLGYYKLESIDKDLTSDSLYNGYISENKLDTIQDRWGEQYYGAGLIRYKGLIEIKSDFSFKVNFDFKKLNTYICNFAKKITKGSKNSTSGNASTASTSGDESTASTSGYKSTASTSGYYSTASTSGDESTASTSGDESVIIINGKNNVGIANGKNVKGMGKIGNYICLTEYDEKGENIIDCKVGKIDGKKIKENIFYALQNGEFLELKE